MLDLYTHLNTLAEALAANAELSAWAASAYGHGHKVFLGEDLRKPPEAADCPYIAVYPESQAYGRLNSQQHIGLIVVCCVHDEAFISHAGLANLIDYAGVRNLEAFRRLAERKLAAVSVGNAVMALGESDYELMEFFPFMMVAERVTYTEDLPLGDPFA